MTHDADMLLTCAREWESCVPNCCPAGISPIDHTAIFISRTGYVCCEPDQIGMNRSTSYAGTCQPKGQVAISSMIATLVSQVWFSFLREGALLSFWAPIYTELASPRTCIYMLTNKRSRKQATYVEPYRNQRVADMPMALRILRQDWL